MVATLTLWSKTVAVVVAATVASSLVSASAVTAVPADTGDAGGGVSVSQSVTALAAVDGGGGTTTTAGRAVVAPSGPLPDVTPVTGCRVIDDPGRYELQQDILDAREVSCIEIRSSDVVFDGNGHTIDAVRLSQFTPIGIDVRPTPGPTAILRNVTVQDVTLTDFRRSGVAFFGTDGGVIRDVRIHDGALTVSTATVTARNVHVSNAGERGATGVRVVDGTVALGDVSVTDSRFAYRFLRSGGHTLVNVSAADVGEVGFRFDEAGGNSLEDVSVVDSAGRGFEFLDAGSNRLTDVAVRNTSGEALLFERSGSNTLTDVAVEQSEGIGVVFNESGGNTLVDVSTTGTALEGIVFVDSGDNTLTDVSVADAGRNGLAFVRLDADTGSSNNTLADVEITGVRLRGLLVSYSGDTSLEGVSLTDTGVGLFVVRSDDLVMEELLVRDTQVEEAIRIAASDGTTVRDVRVEGGAFVGLHVLDASGLRVTDLTVERTETGIVVSNTDDVVLTDVTVADSDENGVEIDASTRVSARDVAVLESDRWDVVVTNSVDDLSVEALTTGSATLSFVGRDVSVAGVESPPPDPTSPDRFGVGVYVETATTTTAGSLDLTVAYDEADATAVEESSLRLWRFADSEWSEVTDSSVDTDAGEVTASVTDGGVLAPLGVEAPDPPVASFTVVTPDPTVGTPVRFDATVAAESDGAGLSYEWDFDGDGQLEGIATSPRVTHVYTSPGTFDVRLTVADAEGRANTTVRTVEVLDPDDTDDGSGDGADVTPAEPTSPGTPEAVTEPTDGTAAPPTSPLPVQVVWWVVLVLLVAGAGVVLVRARS